jgi:hypothetical protein
LGNDTKTFWFRFQNDIGTFDLSFLTLLLGKLPLNYQFLLNLYPSSILFFLKDPPMSARRIGHPLDAVIRVTEGIKEKKKS